MCNFRITNAIFKIKNYDFQSARSFNPAKKKFPLFQNIMKGATMLYSMSVTFSLPISVQSNIYTPNFLLYTPISVCCLPLCYKHMCLGSRRLSKILKRKTH